MSKDKRITQNAPMRPLVPRLRFPEFAEDGGWKGESFETLYMFHTTNSFSRENLNYISGSVKNIHYGDIHTKFSPLFDIKREIVPFINNDVYLDKFQESSYCAEGDVVFADTSEDLKDIGICIEIVHLNNERLLSGLHTILARPKDKVFIVGFCGHLFQSAYIRAQIQNEAQGTKVLGLSAGRLSTINVCYPVRKSEDETDEQQKIADCLTSLDEQITAQGQKIDALKAHKKGLMQKLFPAEGRKVPELRFPEFAGTGEWEEKALGDNCSITTGKLDANAMVENGKYRFYTCAKNFYFIDTYAFDTDALLVSGNGANLGYIHHYKGKFNAYQRTYILDRFSVNILYIRYFLDRNLPKRIFIEKKEGNTPYIVLSTLSEMMIFLPCVSEQQRIADCLTSLDELITAQTRKMELLTEHKKGLMQQLFPNIKEESP